MRLINGSFAFFLLLCLSAGFSGPEFFPVLITGLIYYHALWFINTHSGLSLMDRFGYNISLFAFGTPLSFILCSAISHNPAFSTAAVVMPMMTFLAVANSLYCLKVIITSLPPSLVGRAKSVAGAPVLNLERS